jgi:threonine/homoserine/homoserine lactone efflux protein
MPTLHTFWVFAAAALALAVVPGPAVMYIVTRSIDQGRAAGLASVAGVATGGLVHVVAAAAGISVILVRSATAFEAVKLAGAAYLVVIGVRKLLSPAEPLAETHEARRTLARTYRQGFVVNVLNPKTALFFLALLPQFIDPDRGPAAVQSVLLGLTFVAIAASSDAAYALAASVVSGRLRGNTNVARLLHKTSGAVYVCLGALAAFGHRPTSSPADT